MSRFVRSETKPADLTLYVKSGLSATASDLTGIFFTQNYNSEMPLNLILYLRGWTQGALAIDKFWSDPKQPQRLLREKVNFFAREVQALSKELLELHKRQRQLFARECFN